MKEDNLIKNGETNFFLNDETVKIIANFKKPTRETFGKINLVDIYKKDYINKINNMTPNNNLGFFSIQLRNNIVMIMGYLLDIVSIKNRKELNSENKINYLINSIKLDIYERDLFKMQEDAAARLIALNEVKDENLIFSKNLRAILDNEIKAFDTILSSCVDQELLHKSKINNYLLQSRNYKLDLTNEEEAKILDEKIEKLEKYQLILPSNVQIKIRKDLNYVLTDLAIIEKNLAVYVFYHKDEERILKEQLNNLLKQKLNFQEKEKFLNAIEKIEDKFIIFKEYGRNNFNDKDIYNMYKLKFTILSLSENGISDVFVNDKADKIELSYYQSIVSFIIAQTINGKNPHFKILNRNDNQNAINYMIEFFKDYSDEHKIDPLQILKNFIPLNFVIALDRESGLDIFFNNLDSECVLTKNVNNLEGNIFTWQDKLPLGTNLLMNYYFDKENLVVITKEKISKNLMYFNYIYQKNNMEDGYYQLPEGLIKLNWREDCNNYADKNIKIQEIMLANLKKDVKNKILVMPSTLEDATGQIVIPIKGCVLNENIKHITDSLFSKQKFDVINVPSNLDYATSSLPKFVKSVIFTNFQNTLVFNNQEVADKYNASGYLTNLIDINQNKDKIIVSFNLYQIIFHNLQNNESIKVDPKILELTLDFEPRRCYDYEEKQKYYGELRSQMCNHFLNYARHILSSK